MKKILLLILLIQHIAFSQTYNFKINDGYVIWQAVYNKKIELTHLEKQLRLQGYFDNFQISNNQIICNLNDFEVDFLAQGKTYMNTPIFISQYKFRALVVIDFKPDKYRITLKQIQNSPKEDGPLGNAGEYSYIRDLALKKRNSEFRNGFLNDGAEYLNNGFDKLFNYLKTEKDDDW